MIIQDEIIDILTHTALSNTEICGSILGDGCGSTYDPFNQTWSIPIPGNQPPIKAKTPNIVRSNYYTYHALLFIAIPIVVCSN